MKHDEQTLRPARAADLAAITALLGECGLPASDLTEAHLERFFVATSGELIVGVAGVETAGPAGLLRSLAVAPPWRGRGLGDALVARCESAAAEAGSAALYLLTTSADAFFRVRRYGDVERSSVPPQITGHAQFRDLCPASARCLVKTL